MRYSIIKFIFVLSVLPLFQSNADEIYYEDWSGIYFLRQVHESGEIQLPDFRHFSGNTNHILISTWKGKLILQARIKTMKPLRYGYFDSEIKYPNKKKQTLFENKCSVEIELDKDILKVDMKSIRDCETSINISGEYIRYRPNKKESIYRPKGVTPYFKNGVLKFKD